MAVYSARSVPLAAWTAGYELANLAADADRACLVLETGVNQRWRYGSYRRSPENTAEARAWQDAKAAVRRAAHPRGRARALSITLGRQGGRQVPTHPRARARALTLTSRTPGRRQVRAPRPRPGRAPPGWAAGRA